MKDDRIEVEGKTIDEAITKACETFGVPREKLHIEILAEGTPGFFGLGSKKARIRAGLLKIDVTSIIDEGDGLPARPVPPPETDGSLTTQEGADALRAKEILEGILERMQIPCPVSVEENEEIIFLNIQGDGGGLLIGKKGQNLDALQHILNKAVHRGGNGGKMIVVDTETYRKRREEMLVNLAARLGEKVKKTQKAVTVGNMNAHERRIIHLALKNDTEVVTKSRGEGDLRKILIMPAKREKARERRSHNQEATAK
ncbi:MAG TPA: RNA-binding cell elongation regulator Jag/EloR [Syntrophales bacterium]|nr:RNA-binding cell elongation regulator Jag/EloR [Syntrophales bacterium]HOM07503.1 RNA-binding cell elongation regulator Jag/EloR [Syntrophales bacterium]HON99830.1 RNA-binding cell elongation regulator Jag/EloR [Syntrophales bacterium]HPC01453.1 RNA-binding cell elongation regulator Jag/EloR [Syntrophales bacterium]HPQ07152.1 RNA-binding cell elongation regulator Jag/EloR [Syntrophales bacterium]